jgi:hypothetical protein
MHRIKILLLYFLLVQIQKEKKGLVRENRKKVRLHPMELRSDD